MADLLLAIYNALSVGNNRTSVFIKRHIELRPKFSCKYYYKIAQYEDLVIFGEWFRLVRNTIISSLD